jgi:hypothetical protein
MVTDCGALSGRLAERGRALREWSRSADQRIAARMASVEAALRSCPRTTVGRRREPAVLPALRGRGRREDQVVLDRSDAAHGRDAVEQVA